VTGNVSQMRWGDRFRPRCRLSRLSGSSGLSSLWILWPAVGGWSGR
jgi:hypothetical protein